ncbi:LCP family protein [Agromyces archimandritae]|uniref:LCP family protein n=1 Tax=Agromyces archimandritae TaxID=2781962 RepID=A0A975IMJ5_9MICO|nr:LCP family protein [Agromyces archimandritae]QTX03563.1 LCP family protein [Agromyces archimandritae]
MRHGRLPGRGGFAAAVRVTASIAAVAVVSVGAVGAYAAIDLFAGVGPGLELGSEHLLDDVPDIGAMEGGLNFLLVGSDKRPEDGSFGDADVDSGVLNDVTMLLHISQDHSHVEVVSFPRDMYVDVPECPDPREDGEMLDEQWGVLLNSVFSHGGFGCVARTIEELTGVQIPVGGIVEFEGVAALAEAVGGVEVCVSEPIDDPDANLVLAAGMQKISGYEALGFLRTRHGVADGSDLGRIANQQSFLASLMRTLKSDGTLGDPVKLYSIAKAVTKNMQLSERLRDPGTLIPIALALADTDLSKIAFIQYPTVYAYDGVHVEPAESAEEVNAALVADRPVLLDPDALSNASFGTVDPTRPTTDPPDGSSDASGEPGGDASNASDGSGASDGSDASDGSTADEGDGDAPAGVETPEPTVSLPSDVTGQDATQLRCTAASTGW